MGNSHSLPPDDGGSEVHAKYTNAEQDRDLLPPVPAGGGGGPSVSGETRRKRKKKRTRVKTLAEDATPADDVVVVAMDVVEPEVVSPAPAASPAASPAATTTISVIGEKPRRKKKIHQTSQEEESAQALLALNKGLPADMPAAASVAAAENDDDDAAAAAAAASPPPEEEDPLKRKKKSKDRRKKKLKKHSPSPSLAGIDVGVDIGVDVGVGVATAPAPSQSSSFSPSPAPPDNDATLQHAIQMQHLDDIPDSDRIISQHLAAHMSKHALAPTPSVPDLQDVLMDDVHFAALDDDLLSEPTLASPRKGKPKTYKRKRASPIDDANKLVDPALRELDEAAAAAAAAANSVLSDDTSRKKKRRLPTTLSPKPASKRAPRTRKPSAPSNPSGAPPTATGGTFTLEERHAIDTHLHDYMASHALTHVDLCRRVWSNDRKKDDFWEAVCGVLPLRSRASIYKHVRRSYHVFEQRAKWTPAEDEELARLVAEKGSSWKDVGEAMGRMGEDCRDRWRNYVKCGEGRGKDRWGDEEELELRRVLKDVLRGIKARRNADGDDGDGDDDDGAASIDLDAPDVDGEEDINWTAVSELMGNRRSRIQCRYKWNKMKQQKARQHGLPVSKTPTTTWRKRKLRAAPGDMLTGDRIWVLSAIRDSGAREERAIDWDAIADHAECAWSARDVEKAFKTLRSTLPHRRLPLQEIVNRLLAELDALPAAAKALRFQPEAAAAGYDVPAGYATGSSYLSGGVAIPPPHNPAPVATMGYAQQHHEMEMAMVDPALIGQGGGTGTGGGGSGGGGGAQAMQQDLEKTAGEAILIAQAAVAAAAASKGRGSEMEMEMEGEGETERELRRRLGV